MRPFTLAMVLVPFVVCPTTAQEEPGLEGESSIVIMEPDEGDILWSFPESADELGSGGELQIYIDATSYPEAGASFAKYSLGVGGALPVHKHEKTEEFAYILSGRGAAVALDESGEETEVPISEGYVWYNPRGVWHSVRNKGSEPLVLVFATVPNEAHGLLSFFREISVEPGQEGRQISPEELERLGAEHDLILHRAEN